MILFNLIRNVMKPVTYETQKKIVCLNWHEIIAILENNKTFNLRWLGLQILNFQFRVLKCPSQLRLANRSWINFGLLVSGSAECFFSHCNASDLWIKKGLRGILAALQLLTYIWQALITKNLTHNSSTKEKVLVDELLPFILTRKLSRLKNTQSFMIYNLERLPARQQAIQSNLEDYKALGFLF